MSSSVDVGIAVVGAAQGAYIANLIKRGVAFQIFDPPCIIHSPAVDVLNFVQMLSEHEINMKNDVKVINLPRPWRLVCAFMILSSIMIIPMLNDGDLALAGGVFMVFVVLSYAWFSFCVKSIVVDASSSQVKINRTFPWSRTLIDKSSISSVGSLTTYGSTPYYFISIYTKQGGEIIVYRCAVRSPNKESEQNRMIRENICSILECEDSGFKPSAMAIY